MKLYQEKVNYCSECPSKYWDVNVTRYLCRRMGGKFICWMSEDDDMIPIPDWCPLPDYRTDDYIIQLKSSINLTDTEGCIKCFKEGTKFEILNLDLKKPFFYITPLLTHYPVLTHFGLLHLPCRKKYPITDYTINKHFKWVTNNNPFPPPEYINKEEFQI